MKIKSISLRQIELPLKSPFVTHQGCLKNRPLIIVEVMDQHGFTGYGEVTAFPNPFYTSETIQTAWYVLKDVLIPNLSFAEIEHPGHVGRVFASVKGHPMAKAGLEGALWDLYSKQHNKSLRDILGGTRSSVEAGAVISLTDTLSSDLHALKNDGYQRYKLKVKKGQEKEAIQTVQKLDPKLPIMIDANGQYDEKDMPHLYALDELGLFMIEQPFVAGDFYLHSKLQENLKTPVCLDESIMSFHDAVQAIGFQSCKIINVKISRVGGLTAAVKIHNYCQEAGFPVWCGGMVESGISKAHNLALASLPNFTIPGDLSSSTRYFDRDVIHPGIKVQQGKVEVPQGPGIGVEIDEEYLSHVTRNVYSCKCE